MRRVKDDASVYNLRKWYMVVPFDDTEVKE